MNLAMISISCPFVKNKNKNGMALAIGMWDNDLKRLAREGN